MPETLNFGLYILIFGAKLLENALGTLRLILLSNGRKGLGSVLQFIIVMLWLIVAGSVLSNISEDIISVIMYAVGAAVGTYTGGILEEKIAMGNNMVTVICDQKHGKRVVNRLRSKNIAITELDGKGKVDNKKVLLIVAKRKNKHDIIKLIKHHDPTAMILSESVSDIHGGYLAK